MTRNEYVALKISIMPQLLAAEVAAGATIRSLTKKEQPPSLGKTVMAKAIADQLGRRLLILTDTVQLRTQMIAEGLLGCCAAAAADRFLGTRLEYFSSRRSGPR